MRSRLAKMLVLAGGLLLGSQVVAAGAGGSSAPPGYVALADAFQAARREADRGEVSRAVIELRHILQTAIGTEPRFLEQEGSNVVRELLRYDRGTETLAALRALRDSATPNSGRYLLLLAFDASRRLDDDAWVCKIYANIKDELSRTEVFNAALESLWRQKEYGLIQSGYRHVDPFEAYAQLMALEKKRPDSPYQDRLHQLYKRETVRAAAIYAEALAASGHADRAIELSRRCLGLEPTPDTRNRLLKAADRSASALFQKAVQAM